jgi:hypothetical protein
MIHKIIRSYFTLFLCLFGVNSTNSPYEDCRIYVAPSKIPGVGKGIFAGKDIKKNEELEENPNVIVKTKSIRELQLFNYVYSAEDDDFSMASFGASMLYNHRNPKDIDHFWAISDVPEVKTVFDHPYTTYAPSMYQSMRNIAIGEEIFTSYGTDNWFSDRQIQFSKINNKDVPKYDLKELQQVGYCLDNIYLDDSSIPMAGKGVFSKQYHHKGDIVHVSPVIVLPKHAINTISDHSVLGNYCFEFGNASDVLLFPIALAGMMNHGAGSTANIEVKWFEWDGQNSLLNKPIAELEKLQFAPLFIQYVAKEDIEPHTELLISYGDAWENAWMKYLDDMSMWTQITTLENSDEYPPQFRQYISAPESLYLENIYKARCIGSDCNGDEVVAGNNNKFAKRRKLAEELSKKSKDSMLYFNKMKNNIQHTSSSSDL